MSGMTDDKALAVLADVKPQNYPAGWVQAKAYIAARLRGAGEQGQAVAYRHFVPCEHTGGYWAVTLAATGNRNEEPLYTRPQPVAVAGDAVTDADIDARLNALHRGMRERGEHNGGMAGVAWDRAVFREALSTQPAPSAPVVALLAEFKMLAAHPDSSRVMRTTLNHVVTKLTAALSAPSEQVVDGWERMTEEAKRIQRRHLDNHSGDVYHAMQSLVVRFGKRDTRSMTVESEQVAASDTRACWSCVAPYTLAQRSDADGNCPKCGVEIELEAASDPLLSREGLTVSNASVAVPESQADWVRIARLAGEHGIRYRTNEGMVGFLRSMLAAAPVAPERERAP